MSTEKETQKINAKTGRPKVPSRGGARAGAGRPKGSGNKISARELLDEAQRVVGKPFVTSLMEGYRDTIINHDNRHRVVYERLILDKVASQLFDVETTDSEAAVTAKQAAFAAAIASMQALAPQAKS
jgi:hypothetical protein